MDIKTTYHLLRIVVYIPNDTSFIVIRVPFHRVSVFFAGIFLVLLTLPHDAFGQRDDALEAMLKDAKLDVSVPDPAPVPPSSVSPVNLQVHWKLWKELAKDGKAGADELKALEHDGRSLGYLNQIPQSLAVAAIASQQPNADVGHEMFNGAIRLAPDLPYPYLAQARYGFARSTGSLRHWVVPLIDGFERAWAWPDTRFAWLLKLLLYANIALALAAFSFVIGQTIRHFGIVAYDIARALPRGFSSNQTVVLLLLAVAVPGLVLRSMLASILVLLILLGLTQNVRERVVSALLLVWIAMLPTLDSTSDSLASFFASKSRDFMLAQYTHCDAGCIENLDMWVAKDPADEVALYSRLYAGFRTGQPVELRRIVESVEGVEFSPNVRGSFQNLAGASYIALGEATSSLDLLEKARADRTLRGAPAFNLVRAYQSQDDVEKSSWAFKEAAQLNLEMVSLYIGFSRRDVNSYLVVPPLNLNVFWNYHLEQERTSRSIFSSWWTAVAGPKFSLEFALPAAGASLLLLVLISLVRLKRKNSTPCPRCGMARDPGDDHTTGAHAYCLPCYRTFVTGAGLDYHARVYNETILGRRERFNGFLRRAMTILIPGSGHHLAGRAALGLALTTSLALGALFIYNPMGVVRPPHEFFTDNWGGTATLGWTLFLSSFLTLLFATFGGIAPIERRGK